ncbi:hypothetical protein [Aliamphritea hakodatensis]|uniref:hypothetical protein n=1 Tax=Aliamphritea hakodatensis TaxID=2895352 RepID=UPI0022FD57A6|nr:hypothetical protein [Aliamphritea hakodatensis]
MRNGIDISSFSETVNEVRNDERQGQIDYSAVSSWKPNAGILARVNPARVGTLKAPRIFEIPVPPHATVAGHTMLPEATPQEMAAVALAGCFLVSTVNGLSSIKCTIESLNIGLTLTPVDMQALYTINAQTNRGPEDLERIVGMVKQMSPNHRSFAEALPLTVQIADTTFAFDACGTPEAPAGDPAETHLSCHWLYGTQLQANLGDQLQLPIDQPKQLGGVDWAPNPQEYLLMALSADVLSKLTEHQAVTEQLSQLKIVASARVDIRGMCDVADVPVHLLNIQLQLQGNSDEMNRIANLKEYVQAAISQSTVCQYLRHPVSMVFN